MSTFNALRFSRPAFLYEADRASLLDFLMPHADFFANRELDLASLARAEVPADFAPLVEILMSPGRDTPPSLIDALFIVHELAGANCEDQILALCTSHRIDTTTELTTADLLMKLWFRDRDGLRELHRRQATFRPRSFVYFTSIEEVTDPDPPTARQVEDLRGALDGIFAGNGCGRGLVVHAYIHENEWWFIVRHGERIRKVVGRSDSGDETTYCFHPEKLDVVIYDLLTGELRINASTRKHREYYCQNFGFYLFGSFNFFPGTDKYTLNPIFDAGPGCLRCEDVEGIHRIRLVGLKWACCDRSPPTVVQLSSDNVFSSLLELQKPAPQTHKLLCASFRVYYSENDKRGRSVTIRQPNVVQYTRDSDSAAIELWMRARGFIKPQYNHTAQQHEFTMA